MSKFRKWLRQTESSIILVLFLGIIFQGIHMSSDWILRQHIQSGIRLFDTLKQCRISLTQGQSLLEKTFSEDLTIRATDLLPHYQELDFPTGEKMKGETLGFKLTELSVKNKEVIDRFIHVNASIYQIREMIQNLLPSGRLTTASLITDERIAFYQLMSQINKIDDHLFENIGKMIFKYQQMHWATLVLWLLILTLVCGFLFYHGKKRRETEVALQNSHDEMEYRIAERTAQLSKTNELLNREIAERKRTMAALRESETKYKSLFENMNSGVAVYKAVSDGEDFIFQDFNKAGERIENTPREEVIGKKVTEVFPGVKDFGLFEVFQRVWKTGQPEHHPVALYKDKRISGWRDNFVYRLTSGLIVAVYSDETERMQAENSLRESEEKYRSLVESTDDAVYLIDREYRYRFINEPLRVRLNLPMEDVIGKHYIDLHSAEKTREFMKQVDRVFDTGNSLHYEHQSERDGRSFFRSLSPIQDPHGCITAVTVISKDITDLKKTEEILQESEERYRIIFEQAADSIVVIDPETGGLIAFNEKAHQNLGFTREEFEKISLSDIETVESTEEVKKHIEKILREGTDTFETKQKTKNSEVRDILIKANTISTHGKNYIQSIWHDITEEKRAERALRESERKYRTLFENSKDPVYITSREGFFQDANQAFLDLFGYSRSEMQKLKTSNFYFSPDDRSVFQQEIEKRKFVQDYELKFLKKNGQIMDCLVTATVRQTDDGVILGYQGIIRDITDRKHAEHALRESESRYRSLFENMIVGYAYCKIILDQNYLPADFLFMEINDAFEKLTGFKKADVLGKRATEVTPTIRIEHPELFDDYGSVVMMGKNVQFEIFFKPLKIWLSVSVYSPQQGFFVMMFENITERKQAEEEIRKANEQQMVAHEQRKILSKRLIDLLEKDRRQIAMELHDHIGQSLTSLKIHLEMLRRQTNPDKISLISQIGKAEEKAIQILKDVKDVSRGLRPPVLDALGLVSSLRELFNQVLQQMDIEIHFFNQGIPKKMKEEKELAIYRIAQEALSNIMKHAKAKNVYVNLVRTDGHISLSVEDDGVGFDKEEVLTATNGKGSLGLLIMQERVKQLDGEFTVESRKGHGTHLLAEIPL